jgi:hypothetical protein
VALNLQLARVKLNDVEMAAYLTDKSIILFPSSAG